MIMKTKPAITNMGSEKSVPNPTFYRIYMKNCLNLTNAFLNGLGVQSQFKCLLKRY